MKSIKKETIQLHNLFDPYFFKVILFIMNCDLTDLENNFKRILKGKF